MSSVASSDVDPSASDEEHRAPAPRNGVSATHTRRQGNTRSESQVGPIRRLPGIARAAANLGPLRSVTPATGLPGTQRQPGTADSREGTGPRVASASRNSTSTRRPYPGEGLAGWWPPIGIDMVHVDEDVNEQFISELGTIFELSRPHAELGAILAHVPSPRQYAITVYSLLAVRQAIDALRNEVIRDPRPAATSEAALAPPASHYHYLTVFNEHLKRLIRVHLMDKRLAVYSSERPANSPRRAKGLLTVILEDIRLENPQFKERYLPRGYADGDPAAIASVETHVRNKLRNSRGKMRDLLLTNIQSGREGNETSRPVPTISALLALMREQFVPRAPGEAETQVPRGAESLLKSRLAYLRIQTIIQYVGRGSRDAGRQWKNIDEHLCTLSRKNRPYRAAFNQLVLAYNRATFGQDFFSEMDVDTIALPTDDKVLAQVAINAAEGAPGMDEQEDED
ncbi:hypothetical protein PCASD_01698 [Puccinia coronata f. sp. avenae]|uniref:Uncharacterized protein n=1 Tax=Puccinia coronata f. sp. avenae TaxID=200324 RepID=A0A2N5VK28_9BASI|nr:hypothetical protein PCASD_01698 [Puccinia coronata f. sp. avenae]